jgi:hypothetical protein
MTPIELLNEELKRLHQSYNETLEKEQTLVYTSGPTNSERILDQINMVHVQLINLLKESK